MADTINIAGKPVNKKTVFIVGGGAVIIGGIVYYRHSQASAANAAAASASAAGAQDGSNIDPATGFEYGSPEDQAALAAAAGGQLPTQLDDSSLVTGDGSEIGVDSFGNPVFGTGGAGVPVGFINNAQWSQAAESAMGSDGTDAIAAALGKYLNAAPITTDQITLVQEALAIEGSPPVAGTDGFPPSFHTLSDPPPVQGPNPPIGSGPTPPITGGPKPVPQHTIIAGGGKDLNQIFAMFGVSDETKGIAVNPSLRKYYGTGKAIPKGTRVVIPAH